MTTTDSGPDPAFAASPSSHDVSRPSGLQSGVEGLAERIAELVEEGDGFWRTCTGCYESMDGYPCGDYPHSEVFGCTLGGGCCECGGIGATWDTTDYEEMAEWMIQQDRTRENVTAALNKHLRVYEGIILGIGDAAWEIVAMEPALASGSRRAETSETSAQCEASQSGAAKTAQRPTPPIVR